MAEVELRSRGQSSGHREARCSSVGGFFTVGTLQLLEELLPPVVSTLSLEVCKLGQLLSMS